MGFSYQDIHKAEWIPYGPIECIGICVKRIGHDDIETMSSPSHKSFTIKEGSHFNMTYSQVLFGLV